MPPEITLFAGVIGVTKYPRPGLRRRPLKLPAGGYDTFRMVHLTPRAAAKALELLAAENDPALTCLRLAVEGGGCSGYQYALGFDGEPAPGDAVAEEHGLRVLVDERSRPLLEGAGVDYVEGLTGAGFQVTNPNMVASCGCGNSFLPRSEPELEPAAGGAGCDC
jgi:iron-sulfur cluster assembly protein